MQLVVRQGAVVGGVKMDQVIATHDDSFVVPEGAYPGTIVVPFEGGPNDLPRVGPEPENPDIDTRPIRMPTVDLAGYAAAARYDREKRTVTVTIGQEKVPLSIARGDRDGLRDTLLAISTDLRKDGAAFKFADGVSRPASNAEMQIAVAKAFSYVQALFDKEAEVQAGIGGKYKTIASIEAAFDSVKA